MDDGEELVLEVVVEGGVLVEEVGVEELVDLDVGFGDGELVDVEDEDLGEDDEVEGGGL